MTKLAFLWALAVGSFSNQNIACRCGCVVFVIFLTTRFWPKRQKGREAAQIVEEVNHVSSLRGSIAQWTGHAVSMESALRHLLAATLAPRHCRGELGGSGFATCASRPRRMSEGIKRCQTLSRWDTKKVFPLIRFFFFLTVALSGCNVLERLFAVV